MGPWADLLQELDEHVRDRHGQTLTARRPGGPGESPRFLSSGAQKLYRSNHQKPLFCCLQTNLANYREAPRGTGCGCSSLQNMVSFRPVLTHRHLALGVQETIIEAKAAPLHWQADGWHAAHILAGG